MSEYALRDRRESLLAPRTSAWPRHEPDEISAAVSVLEAGRVNGLVHRTETEGFAVEFAEYVGMPHGLCVANGTVALELILRAMGIGSGDEVIVPARSFFATASAVLAVGAVPAFADVLPETHNIDPASIARLAGPKTKAVICVHLGGVPAEMQTIGEVAAVHGLLVIEDCAQAHGARRDGRIAGAWGDAAAFSFCTDKIMSTGGEGGLCLFRHGKHYDAAWSYKDHGKSLAKLSDGKSIPGHFRHICDGPGTNFRLTEMQAAIGRRQLLKLPDWLDRRRANAATLITELAQDARIALPRIDRAATPSWYKFNFALSNPANERVEDYRARVIANLLANDVAIGTGSCPDMSREAAFSSIAVRRDGCLPAARDLGRRSLMLQVDHTLDGEDMRRIAAMLLRALDQEARL